MKKYGYTAAVVLIGAGVWYFLSPLFLSSEVHEPFPTAEMLARDPSLMEDMSPEELEHMRRDILDEAAKMADTPMSEPMSIMMDESGDVDENGIGVIFGDAADKLCGPQPPAECGMGKQLGCKNSTKQWQCSQIKTETTGPVALLSGTFIGRDNFHQGSGSATLYRLSDNSLVLRLEDFSVTNGPDLRVLLARGNDPVQSIELAALKGNRGDQNYSIPTGTDITTYDSVIIYCKPFHVIFATAELR